ncbi:hypothetical protein BCR35DRAFT_149540 [Leucosporidium creatinivorum]|uniref:Uncharacterized protein n=1 Tax=Leucosporidium creatinivorum TaxID=106004 RepID=A0A1Y2EPE2_9BASI|nr:hypothetical protein BCR35DRAFT_149540 [Leucosporidium creatinivorum]
MEMHNRRRDSIAAPLATAELPLSSAVLALEREASLERRDCEIQPHPLSSSSPPPHTGKMPRDYYPPPPPKSSWSHDEDTPTSPQGASAFEKSHSRAMELMRKIRRRRRPQPQPAAEPQQYASRRRPAPPLIIEEAANSPSHPLPRAQNDPSTLFRHPPPALVRQSIASDDQARSAPSPSSPREQVAPEDGLTITIPIPRAALRSRPKHRYISPTKLDHPPLPSPSSPNPSPTELANLAGKPSPSVPQRRDSGVDADTPRLLPPSPLPAAGEPVSTSATSRFARTRERRRRAREYSVSCVGMFPMDGARPSKTLIIPFLSPPHPPSSSIPSFAGSGERPLPPALSNSADFTLTVHQATPLYPGDMFSFIVEIKDPPSTSSPPTFSLSFSAHSFLYPSPSYVAHDASITHHTLFSRTNQIPVPTNRATTPLSLPFSTSIPLSVECETCSAHYDLLPPSLRVEDPDGNLRARVSYELMATWGEKVAVAEVQVAQRREVVQEKLRRGQWVKLEGEKEMQGGWEGWDLTRVEVR